MRKLALTLTKLVMNSAIAEEIAKFENEESLTVSGDGS